MADLPPPPPAKEDPADFAVVTMVHKVKSRLGYTEMITPTPINQLGGDNQVPIKLEKLLRWSILKHSINSMSWWKNIFTLIPD